MNIVLSAADWLTMFGHYMILSLLSVGGAIATAPDMHRFLVDEHGWMTDPQFSSSIAIAQSAPGPNVLFVALMGWNVGLNAGGVPMAFFGVLVAMAGILIPSTTITYTAARWAHVNRELRGVRAFKQGLSPIVIALLTSTGWILGTSGGFAMRNWPILLLAIVSTLVMWRTRIHLLWLLAAGALLGWVGWI